MEMGNLEHLDPETVIVMLLLHSASPHGRRLAKKLLTDDPYDVNIEPDKDTVNINSVIAHVYLKAIGIRMIFKKTLIPKIIPATIHPAICTRAIPTDANGNIIPAYFYTEQEREYYGQYIKPAHVDELLHPAYITPAHVVKKNGGNKECHKRE